MKNHALRGLTALFLFALLLLISLTFSTVTAQAAPTWEIVLFTPIPEGQYKEVITTVEQTFYTSLWHYSGGYWENDDKTIRIKDTVNLDQKEELTAALNKEISFNMPIPAEVKAELDQGYKVVISCQAGWGLDAANIFYLDKGHAQFKFDGDIFSFRAYPKVNFLPQADYRDYVLGLDNAIPFADPKYGSNTYSIFTRGGAHVGSATNYINPSDPMQLPDPDLGQIHPSQIINNNGHLESGLKIRVYDANGKESIHDSGNVAIGAGTFKSAGAVGLRFWYPLKITFYLVQDIADDVAVTKITPTSFPGAQNVEASVTVANLGDNELTSSLNFNIPGIINETETVVLAPRETQEVIFSFDTPESGNITMTAEANQEQAFPEQDYSNNKLSVVATIEPPPVIVETNDCNTVITWTESDSHKVYYSCSNPDHSRHSRTCRHTFTYQTTLTTTHKVDPTTFKSGYGFTVDVDCSISTRMTANYGCGSWGGGRSPSNTPAPPNQVEIRMPWKVTNSLGTQSYTVLLGKTASTSTTSKFSPLPNPISEIRAKKIYTDVALAGTKAAPKVHEFNIYISGGGVKGVEFCKTIKESVTINGDMYEDDFTGAGGR